MPAFQPPQLATLVDHVPPGSAWVHEMKYDGYRCLIAVGGGKARAYTRSGLDWSDKFAPIIAAAEKLKVQSALIDGEAVVLDAAGKSNFQALQASLKGGKADSGLLRIRSAGARRRGSKEPAPNRAQESARQSNRRGKGHYPLFRTHPRERREAPGIVL